MRIEHVAFQVEDPIAIAAWYVKNLGFKIVRENATGVKMHFIGDDSGRGLIELYNNPKVKVPDYKSMDPLLLHVAFQSADVRKDRDTLLAAGATLADDLFTTPAGDELIMLRDPWGLAIQLCWRKNPMI